MTPAHVQQFLEEISKTIEVEVNGKLDSQHKILEKQNEAFRQFVSIQTEANEKQDKRMEEHMTKYTESDARVNTFMARALPYIESFESAHRMGKTAIFWGSVVSAVGGAIFILKSFTK